MENSVKTQYTRFLAQKDLPTLLKEECSLVVDVLGLDMGVDV